MLRQLLYLPLYLTAILSLLTLTIAAENPSNSDDDDVTWLYPSLAAPSLSFNILDTVNVTWISTRTPAFLKLSCRKGNNPYSSELEIPVPATGNRLISLMILSSTASSSTSTYDTCRFELSSPTNSPNLSESAAFNLTAISTREPSFWSIDSSTFSSSSEKFLEQQARAQEARCKNKNTSTSAMAAIGVGVAVGVFALTTACFVLYEVQRRKKRQAKEDAGEGEGDGEGPRERESEVELVGGRWIVKGLKGGDAAASALHYHQQQQQYQQQQDKMSPRTCGTMEDFSGSRRKEETHPAERGQGEQRQGELYELESPLGGRYG
ncbi:MAG: hypothetical protein LQ337_005635 [Flavoplaca oasis]|nr:MAG: hypothetical protein LQ337_005635 [Flavoplaca oasis]